jgi:two-component system nitrogen regulation sensor histidine kinase NtrY
VTLRRRFLIYLVALHLLFAGLAVWLLEKNRLWLLAVEGVFVLSAFTGWRLVRGLFGPLHLLRTGAQLLAESDFTSRFRETGRPEMDDLIGVYNRMADHLREERTRLQEQRHLLGLILEASPSGIAILDFDGRIELVNPAAERLLGLPAALLRGRPPGAIEAPLVRAVAGLPPGSAQVVPAGGGRRVKCHHGSFLDRGFSRSFLLFEELTEELRQFEKAAYEKLVRTLSHEVNNTLGASNSLLHSCLAYGRQLAGEDREDFERALRVVIGRTEQLNAFMKGFADLVRLPPPRRQPCDVRELLEGIALLLRPVSEERRIAWRWEIENGLSPVPMDRAQMEQVFVNVGKNALEAVGEGGTVTVRVGRREGRPFAEVEDTGPGLSPEARANLFTPFFSTKENGQGLGLTLVSEVLAQHGFDYALEGPSGGPTRFTVLF